MALGREHELHRRRFGRNLGVGLALGAFVVLLVVLTMVKVSRAAAEQGYADKASQISQSGEAY